MSHDSPSLAASPLPEGDPGTPILPPLAPRQPLQPVVHGDRRIDDYAWLRHKKDPRVLAYLEAENAYADACLKPHQAFQEALYYEMLSRIQQTDLSVPYHLRGYSYYSRTEEGKQYPIYCRKREHPVPAEEAADPTQEEVLLDLNALAEGHPFLGLGSFDVSDNNRLLAYSTDNTGFRQFTLHVKHLETHSLLPLRIERVTSAAWASDSLTLFYVVEDEVSKRSHRLYRHVLGSNYPDVLLFEEKARD